MAAPESHRLTRQIVIAMIAGIVLGVAINLLGAAPWMQNFVVDGLLHVVGSVFVAALKMMVVPLVLVSLVVGVTAIVGVVMAYLNIGEAPEALKTHYRMQIRTFWIGLLYGVVGVLLSFILIGFAVLAFTAVWIIIRCVKGLKHLERREAYPNPATWLW